MAPRDGVVGSTHMSSTDNIWSLVEPVVNGLGYEVVDIEYKPHPRNGLLRVYIDQEQGIQLEDCEVVSRQISAMLDVEDPISGHYTLEVSSPGLDRPLRRLDDFQRFVGETVKVKMGMPNLEGQRNFTGKLVAVEGDDIIVEVDGQPHTLPVGGIDKARLVPQF